MKEAKYKSYGLDLARYERLEAEAKRRRKVDGESIEWQDILREAIDEKCPPE